MNSRVNGGTWRMAFIRTACTLLMFSLLCDADVTEADKLQNAVEIQFYQVTVQQWNEKSASNTFKTILAEECQKYCNVASNMASCGLEVSGTISKDNVVFIDEYPKDVNGNLKLKFYISHLGGTAVVKKSALKEIIVGARSSVHTKTGYSIEDVDGSTYNIFPNTILDISISVSACAVLLIIVISLVAYLKYRSHQSKKRARQRLIQQQRVPKMKTSPKVRNGKVGHRADVESCANYNEEDGKAKCPSSSSTTQLITETTASTHENGHHNPVKTVDEAKSCDTHSEVQKSDEITEESKFQHSNSIHNNRGKVPHGVMLQPLTVPPVAGSNHPRDLPPLTHRTSHESAGTGDFNEDSGIYQAIDGTNADDENGDVRKKRRRKKKRDSKAESSLHENLAFENNEGISSSNELTADIHLPQDGTGNSSHGSMSTEL